jgi:hypothetical protein
VYYTYTTTLLPTQETFGYGKLSNDPENPILRKRVDRKTINIVLMI